jgi:hypothetical protein
MPVGAVEPEPDVPALTKYRVCGASKVCGVEPGKTFEKAFPPKQEAQLLAGGAIEKVGGKPAATKASREAGSPDKEKE